MLIVHPGALGDVLLSVPAIQWLRHRGLDHHLVLLARSDIGALLQAGGLVDRCLSIDAGDLASLMAGADQVTPRLRDLMKSCVHAVAWLKDSDRSLEATLRELGVRRIAVGTPTPSAGVHQSRRFFDILGEEKPRAHSLPGIILPEAIKKSGLMLLKQMGLRAGPPYVICHPGSGSQHKCVQPETMALVIEELSRLGVLPVLAGGPADEVVVRTLTERVPARIPVIQGQDLSTIAGVLAGARLFVGHDSGLTHLASALGLPTVAIFGPTDPKQWAPMGARVSIVTGPPCSCRTWQQVQECSAKPCLSISPETIVTACSSLLGRYHPVTKS